MTLAVWNCHSRKVSPPPRVRETKRSPRQILPKQYLPGVQTHAKLPLSGGTKAGRLFVYLEKRNTVVWSQVSPGRSTQEGKLGWLGLSG